MSVENPKFFPTPMHLTPQLKGFPLEFVIGARVKEAQMMELPDG